jgi:2-polyprenyl-3-methyl-5-hydroxy-6-metoxy-1,4-benzoquinol methylase
MYCPCPYHEKAESLILFKSGEKKNAKLDVKCTSQTHDKPTLYKCGSCKLIFSEHIKKNFEEDYSKVEDAKYIDQIPYKEKYFELLLSKIKFFLNKEANVLEIGSYYGVFGNLIKPLVKNYTGLELSKHAAKYSENTYDLNIENESLNKFLNKNHQFDIIIMSDVVEHLDDPFNIFKLIEKNLKPNGVLIFTTFNMDAFVPKLLGRKYHWIMPMHKFYFTNKTIKYSLNNNNMEIIKIKKDTRLISIGYLLYKLSILISALNFLFKFLLKFDFLKKRTIKINLFDLNIYFVKKIQKI